MYPEASKRRCIDRLIMLCKEPINNTLESYEVIRDMRRNFDYQIGSLLGEFNIKYDDMYSMFDEVWEKEVDLGLKDQATIIKQLEDKGLKDVADVLKFRNNFLKNPGSAICSDPVVAGTAMEFFPFILAAGPFIEVYGYRCCYENYVKSVEEKIVKYINDYGKTDYKNSDYSEDLKKKR